MDVLPIFLYALFFISIILLIAGGLWTERKGLASRWQTTEERILLGSGFQTAAKAINWIFCIIPVLYAIGGAWTERTQLTADSLLWGIVIACIVVSVPFVLALIEFSRASKSWMTGTSLLLNALFFFIFMIGFSFLAGEGPLIWRFAILLLVIAPAVNCFVIFRLRSGS